MGGIAPGIAGRGSLVSEAELIATAKGFVAEAFPFCGYTSTALAPGTTTATSNIQGTLVGIRAGTKISNLIRFCVAAGASVTLSKMALYDKTGKLLAATADNHASLAVNSYQVYAIAKDGTGNTITSYTIPTDDGYYIACLDLASGGTAPTFSRCQSATGGGAVVGSGVRPYFNVSAQSDMAGNITPADASVSWWFAAS